MIRLRRVRFHCRRRFVENRRDVRAASNRRSRPLGDSSTSSSSLRNDLSIDGRAAARCSDQRFISDRTTLFASGPRIINGSPSRRASVGQIVHSATCFVSANSRISRRRPDSKAKLPDDDRALRSSGSQFTSPHENGEDLVHQTHKPSKINCNRRFVYAGRPAST